jgi:DNA-binding CsgD family transcriptional regulator
MLHTVAHPPAPLASTVIGRDAERDAIGRFLEREHPGLLLIEGEAGIGKTTLWMLAQEAASSLGFRVLSWRASSAESDLAFSSLMGLLLQQDIGRVWPALAGPRRSALEVALGREDPGPTPPDPALVGMAVTDLLLGLASPQRLVVAVDDVQWCDRASQDALGFAARRFGAERVALLVTRRIEPRVPPPALRDAVPADRRMDLSVGPMSVGALGRLIHDRLDVGLSRPLLIRLHEATRGNPFSALEMARALLARGSMPGPGEPFPVPPEAVPLARDRLSALGPAARRALLLVALSSHPTLGLLERVLGAEAGPALDEAFGMGVVVVEADRLRPAHPLLASTIYADAPPGERRSLRMALAAVAEDPVERAIHLAATAEGRDQAVSEALAAAARTALSRGAPGVAGELFTRAASLAEEPGDRDRHSVEAARACVKAGDATRAEAILRSVLGGDSKGRRRAEALLGLGELVYFDRPPEALPLLVEALDFTEGDPALEATVLCHLAAMADSDPDRALASSLAAGEIVDRPGVVTDPDTIACALLERAYSCLMFRMELARDDIDRAMVELPRTGDTFAARRARELAERLLYHQGRLREALAMHQAERARLAERGQVGLLPPLLQDLAVLHQLLGEWDAARERARECLDLVQQGEEVWRQRAVLAQARILAWEGDLDAARSMAVEALAREETEGDIWEATIFAVLAGFVELSVPDPARALEHLLRAHDHAREVGVRLPTVFRYMGDLVEAAALAGELELAEHLLEEHLEGPSERVPLPWIVAMAGRGRGLLAAARGDLDRSVSALDRSVDVLAEACPMPFERARSLLCRGQVQRRAGRRRLAREDLEASLAIFGGLGAKAWGHRAEEELAHLSGRAASGWELTPSERRVAELAAAGRSNREIAAELFLSVRTVESQLSAAYRKLGVRSRTQLGPRLRSDPAVRRP